MWEYYYDENADETTICWNGEEQTSIGGQITQWQDGYPATEEAREAIAEAIQDAGTPERIRMQFDFNYGFRERSDGND